MFGHVILENKPQGRSGDDERNKSIDDNKPKFDPKVLLNVRMILSIIIVIVPYKVEDPLGEAIKFLLPLQTMCRDNVKTHLLAYAIHSRRRELSIYLSSLHLYI